MSSVDKALNANVEELPDGQAPVPAYEYTLNVAFHSNPQKWTVNQLPFGGGWLVTVTYDDGNPPLELPGKELEDVLCVIAFDDMCSLISATVKSGGTTYTVPPSRFDGNECPRSSTYVHLLAWQLERRFEGFKEGR
jgi:hypothetical protein